MCDIKELLKFLMFVNNDDSLVITNFDNFKLYSHNKRCEYDKSQILEIISNATKIDFYDLCVSTALAKVFFII